MLSFIKKNRDFGQGFLNAFTWHTMENNRATLKSMSSTVKKLAPPRDVLNIVTGYTCKSDVSSAFRGSVADQHQYGRQAYWCPINNAKLTTNDTKYLGCAIKYAFDCNDNVFRRFLVHFMLWFGYCLRDNTKYQFVFEGEVLAEGEPLAPNAYDNALPFTKAFNGFRCGAERNEDIVNDFGENEDAISSDSGSDSDDDDFINDDDSDDDADVADDVVYVDPDNDSESEYIPSDDDSDDDANVADNVVHVVRVNPVDDSESEYVSSSDEDSDTDDVETPKRKTCPSTPPAPRKRIMRRDSDSEYIPSSDEDMDDDTDDDIINDDAPRPAEIQQSDEEEDNDDRPAFSKCRMQLWQQQSFGQPVQIVIDDSSDDDTSSIDTDDLFKSIF